MFCAQECTLQADKNFRQAGADQCEQVRMRAEAAAAVVWQIGDVADGHQLATACLFPFLMM